MKRRTKVAALLLVLGMVVLVFVSTRRTVIEISFAGYKTKPDGATVAECEIRNVTEKSLIVLELSPQVQSGNEWQPATPSIVAKRLFTPGMGTRIEIPAPSSPVTWRAGVIARTYNDERLEVTARRLLWLWLQAHPRDKFFGEYFFSAPIPAGAKPVSENHIRGATPRSDPDQPQQEAVKRADSHAVCQ